MIVKRAIVQALTGACEVMGHPHACRLAMWSSNLDERWGAGVWQEVSR